MSHDQGHMTHVCIYRGVKLIHSQLLLVTERNHFGSSTAAFATKTLLFRLCCFDLGFIL